MILFDKDNLKYHASRCKKPRIGSARNHRLIWEEREKSIDGKKVWMWFEVGYGSSFYFEWAGEWYRLRMFVQMPRHINDPFEVSKFWTVAQVAEMAQGKV